MNSGDPTVHFRWLFLPTSRENVPQFLAARNECLSGDGEERSRPDIGAFLKGCPKAQRSFCDLLDVELSH